MPAVCRALPLGFALVLLLIPAQRVAAQDGLAFSEEDALTAQIKDGAGSLTVIVVNPGEDVRVDWSVQLAPGADGKARTATVEPPSSTIPKRAATPIQLRIAAVSTTGKLSGVLVGTPATGGPITRPLTISNFGLSLPLDPATVALIVVVFTLVILLIRMARLPSDLNQPIRNPKWDYTTTWTATFTGAGALLATIVASSALPEEPYLFDKTTFAGLAILFGALGLLAPVIFSALNGVGRIGTVRLFSLSTWISTSAVIGQLTTIVLLLIDASGQGTDHWFVIALIALEVIGVAATYTYIYRGVPKTLRDAITASTDAPPTPPIRTEGVPGGTVVVMAPPPAPWSML